MSSTVADYARAEALARIRPRAQGLLDEVLFPWNIRDLLTETDAEYERINDQARGTPGWDAEYRSWKTFRDENKNPGWLSSSQETAQAIRRRQARLADWQKQLAAKGAQTGPDVKVSGPAPLIEPPSAGWSQWNRDLGRGIEAVAKWGATAAALYLASRALGIGEKITRKGSDR